MMAGTMKQASKPKKDSGTGRMKKTMAHHTSQRKMAPIVSRMNFIEPL